MQRATAKLAAWWVFLVWVAVSAPGARAETIELMPDGGDYWSMRNVFAPLTSVFLGPSYWYGDRQLVVATTPADAIVDIFYVRGGFQKRFEQADAPVTILLPKRIDANPKDVVIVRAFAEGYRIQETTVQVKSRTDKLEITLDILPNALESVAHTYFAGRGSLTFYTKEALSLRLQDREGGFGAALHETAKSDAAADALARMQSPLLASVAAHQLGEDLLVQAKYGAAANGGEPEIRSRQGQDPIRDLHVFTLDIVGPGAGTTGVNRARAALARIRTSDVSGCAAKFDDALRGALEPAELTRALTPHGSFIDPYLRAAMRRLGELSPGGTVKLVGGARYDTRVPLHLAAAQNEAGSVRGYLALLRRFVALMEPADQRSAVLRGLLTPELAPEAFADALATAQAAERACR